MLDDASQQNEQPRKTFAYLYPWITGYPGPHAPPEPRPLDAMVADRLVPCAFGALDVEVALLAADQHVGAEDHGLGGGWRVERGVPF